MKLQYIFISILVVSMLALGMQTYLTDIGSSYSETVDLSSLDNTTSRLTRHNQIATNLSNSINSIVLEEGLSFDIPYKLIKAVWQSTKLMFSSWSVTESMVYEIGGGLSKSGIPLPVWLIPTIIAIIIITLVSIIIYAIFKWKFED